jgi:tetratricopeptide (TPR) repeat protein
MTQALVGRAEQACAGGRCEEAVGLLEQLAPEQPGNYNLYFTLGLCTSGGCRKHALVSAAMAAAYLRRALELLGPGGGTARAAILDALGNALARIAGDERAGALRAAVAHQAEAAEIYSAHGEEDDWARVQFNLGNSLCDLSESTGEDHWHEAVGHYEEALRIRTRARDPERYAAVLENLGSAYRRVDVRRAIRCYRRALVVYERFRDPARKAAAIENNLGNAYLSLPDTDRRVAIRNASRALYHFDRALRLEAQDPDGDTYAIAEHNRAQACARLIRMLPKS